MSAGNRTILVTDRAGQEVPTLWYEDADGKLVPYHRLDASQLAALTSAIAALRTPPTYTDVSGKIASGGQAQTFRGADAGSKFLYLRNPPNAPGLLYFSDALDGNGNLIAATVDPTGKSNALAPGQDYTWPNGVANAVSIISETTDHPFVGRKG